MADLTGRTVMHYRVLGKLGQGGMGTVYRAEDERLRRAVALKFLSPEVLSDTGIRARFVREAQAAAGLDHPNICTVYGLEVEAELSFIVMACVDGPTLEQSMARGIPLAQTLDCAIAIAEGLQCAHNHGVIHRDIKATNVLFTSEGIPKITDFGLARLENRSRLTTPGTVLGTITAMAPEQLRAEDADRRTDIWAFGVLLYEMLTGRRPFDRPSAQETMRAILNQSPPSPDVVDPRLPHEFAWLFEKVLAKSRGERYQHIDDLVTDLRAIRRRLTPGQEGIVVRFTRAADAPTAPLSSSRTPEPAGGIEWPILIATGAVLIVVIALLIVRRFHQPF